MKPLDSFKTLSSCVYPDRTSILSHNMIFSDPNQVVFVPNHNRNITTLLSRHKIKDLTQRNVASIHDIHRPDFSTLILATECSIHNVTFIRPFVCREQVSGQTSGSSSVTLDPDGPNTVSGQVQPYSPAGQCTLPQHKNCSGLVQRP